jgi:hypothetical protein
MSIGRDIKHEAPTVLAGRGEKLIEQHQAESRAIDKISENRRSQERD